MAIRPARLTGIRDGYIFYQAMDSKDTGKQSGAVDSLEGLRLIRHGHLITASISVAGAGILGYLIGEAQGDDPPGWFSFSKEKKAKMAGGMAAILTAMIGGTIELLREINVDVPLGGLSTTERYKRMQGVWNRSYRSQHPLIVGIAGNYIFSETGNKQMAYQASAYLPLKPRSWIGVNIGHIPWMDWVIKDEFHDSLYASYQKEKSTLTYVNLSFRAFLWSRGKVLPYFTWGVSWGKENKKIHSKYVDYYYNSSDEHITTEDRSFLGIPVGVGSLVPVSGHTCLDLQLEYVFRESTYWRWQVGMNYMF